MDYKKVKKNNLTNRLDREYRDIDTLESVAGYMSERDSVNKLLKECGFKVKNYKLNI